MRGLAAKRCFNHAGREAAAKCGGCGRFFCRECVSDHDERLVCAVCLARSVAGKGDGAKAVSRVFGAAGFAAGLMLCWLVFHGLGDALLRIPDSFHEGAMWNAGYWLDR